MLKKENAPASAVTLIEAIPDHGLNCNTDAGDSKPANAEKDETQTLLNSLEEGRMEVPFAQAFIGDKGHLTITAFTEGRRGVFMVQSPAGLAKLSDGAAKPYAQLVKPRWSKDGLAAYLSGHHSFDPLSTYQQLKGVLGQLIDFAEPISIDIVCCYIMGTYCFQLFDAFPYLGPMGPKGSGKTKLGSIIEEVAFNPIRADSITPAQLFRIVDVTGGTLILDEQEALGGKFTASDYLNILRGGYKKGGRVLRSKEGPNGYSTEEFGTYGPKVIINTSGMEELLADRCIPVHMIRSNGAQGSALVSDFLSELGEVRSELYSLTLRLFPLIRDLYRSTEFAPDLHDRQRERWLPILAIAKTYCPDRLQDLEETALKDIGNNILTDSIDNVFLTAMDKLVSVGTVKLRPRDISEAMQQIQEASWQFSSSKVGLLVRKHFGNVSSRSEGNGGTCYIITRAQVDDVLERYHVQPAVRKRAKPVDQALKERLLAVLDGGWTESLQLKKAIGPFSMISPALEELVGEGKIESNPPRQEGGSLLTAQFRRINAE